MLRKLLASRFERRMSNGRTLPCLITCEDAENGNADIEVVVKFSNGCFENVKNLAIEALASMLAADLNLPVPEPFLVEVDDVFIDSIVGDDEIKSHIRASNRIAFGARRLPDGFGPWLTNGRIPKKLTQVAAEVFVFDAIIANADRRPVNPNCLSSGDAIAIFDHELTLAMHQILFWKEPWAADGFDAIAGHGHHIFAPCYFEEKPNSLEAFALAWESLPAERFAQYCSALPEEWLSDPTFLNNIVIYLGAVKENIRTIIDRGLEKLQ